MKMQYLSWDKIIRQFDDVGLNIFLSTSLNKLPIELKNQLIKDQYDLENYKSVVLIGNGGRIFWEKLDLQFNHSLDPVDDFCINKLKEVLPDDFQLLYPVKNLHPPLQALGRFFHFAYPSPLGLDNSFEFGPWFAYRLMFLTKYEMEEKNCKLSSSPCDKCPSQDCITQCPAQATSRSGILINKCLDFRSRDNSSCRNQCIARISCPYKSEHQYSVEQMNYHMSQVYKLI